MRSGEGYNANRENKEEDESSDIQEGATGWEAIKEDPAPAEYIEIDGIRLINVDAIEIDSEDGKYEWLDSLLTNSEEFLGEKIRQAQEEDDEDGVEANEEFLRIAQRKQLILNNHMGDLLTNDDMMGNLWRLRNQYAQKYAEASERQGWGENIADKYVNQLGEDMSLTHDLCSMLRQEIVKRNPEEYVDTKQMKLMLDSQYQQAERDLDNSYADGYYGEDGYMHKVARGSEESRTRKTEDAEWDLEQLKKEQEVLQAVTERFQGGMFQGVEVPKMPQKTVFANCVDDFVREKSEEINQLIEDSHQLVPESRALKANAMERRELAQQRSAAGRLKGKFCV